MAYAILNEKVPLSRWNKLDNFRVSRFINKTCPCPEARFSSLATIWPHVSLLWGF